MLWHFLHFELFESVNLVGRVSGSVVAGSKVGDSEKIVGVADCYNQLPLLNHLNCTAAWPCPA